MPYILYSYSLLVYITTLRKEHQMGKFLTQFHAPSIVISYSSNIRITEV